jgi:hypothetical protein
MFGKKTILTSKSFVGILSELVNGRLMLAPLIARMRCVLGASKKMPSQQASALVKDEQGK